MWSLLAGFTWFPFLSLINTEYLLPIGGRRKFMVAGRKRCSVRGIKVNYILRNVISMRSSCSVACATQRPSLKVFRGCFRLHRLKFCRVLYPRQKSHLCQRLFLRHIRTKRGLTRLWKFMSLCVSRFKGSERYSTRKLNKKKKKKINTFSREETAIIDLHDFTYSCYFFVELQRVPIKFI